MKYILLLSLTVFIWSCQNEEPISTTCVEIKLIDEICGNAIVEVLDTKYFDLAEPTFVRTDGTILKNVFSTSLACIKDNKPAIGSTFYVEIAPSSSIANSECIQCLAIFDSMPAKFHHVKLAENCTNTGND
jgi:hypothetical protein